MTPTFHPLHTLACPAAVGGLKQLVCDKDLTLYSITSTALTGKGERFPQTMESRGQSIPQCHPTKNHLLQSKKHRKRNMKDQMAAGGNVALTFTNSFIQVRFLSWAIVCSSEKKKRG